MAEKRAKQPKDLETKTEGARVKGGKNALDDRDTRRKLVRRTLKRVRGGPDDVIHPKN